MHSNGSVCFGGIGYMKTYCRKGMCVCTGLEYIGIYSQMGLFVCINHDPICLHGIEMHGNLLMEWTYLFTWNWHT